MTIEDGAGRPIGYDFDRVYTGRLADVPGSTVEGVVSADSGHFDGHISTPGGERFYVEPAHRYQDLDAIHTVIYKASDVEHPSSSSSPSTPCKSHELHLKRREEEQKQQQQSFMSKKRTKRSDLTDRLEKEMQELFFQRFQPEDVSKAVLNRSPLYPINVRIY